MTNNLSFVNNSINVLSQTTVFFSKLKQNNLVNPNGSLHGSILDLSSISININLKSFYFINFHISNHHLYQLFTYVTELNGQRMTKLLPGYPCIRIFLKGIPYKYPYLSVDQDMIKRQMALIVAYTFRPLMKTDFMGLVAESLKIVLKTQQSVCDHCKLLLVGKGSCYL